MDIKQKLAQVLIDQGLDMPLDEIIRSLETPPNKEMGDYAFPCFRLAKTMRMAPAKIAEDLVGKISADFIEKAVNLGPYINFYINYELLAKTTITEILDKKEAYGSSDMGQGKNIVIA